MSSNTPKANESMLVSSMNAANPMTVTEKQMNRWSMIVDGLPPGQASLAFAKLSYKRDNVLESLHI